jgi:hypothetical protein
VFPPFCTSLGTDPELRGQKNTFIPSSERSTAYLKESHDHETEFGIEDMKLTIHHRRH